MQNIAERRTAENLLALIPGTTRERVVVSAHYDGHDLSESAIDNASGTAVALAVARALAPLAGRLRRAVHIALFTVEEWGLKGSASYVDGLSDAVRRDVSFVLNLDSVVGNGRTTFLTGGFPELEAFLRDIARRSGVNVETVNRLMANSDHFNFARHGIPAVRMMSGFNDPLALTRFILGPADTRDKVNLGELKLAALLASEIALAAAMADAPVAAHRSSAEMQAILDPGTPR
jgi:Zn-dependent M28 family amino/carboxypeptidase